jgi:F420H(2)-dependent quinone reductase
MGGGRNWVDRSRVVWRVSNRIEAFELRKLGTSLMALLNRGDVLVIETVGRRSGRRRFTPVAYWQRSDGAYVVGGGAAGKTSTPDWVANLRSGSAAAVWIGRRRIAVTATELAGDERASAQRHATSIWPGVERYERMSGRVIPYFRLTTM